MYHHCIAWSKKSWQGELEDLSLTPTSTILWPSAFLSHHPCHPHHSQQHQDLFRKFSTLIDVPLKTSESSLHLKPTDKRCWVFLEDYLFQETFGAVFGGWRWCGKGGCTFTKVIHNLYHWASGTKYNQSTTLTRNKKKTQVITTDNWAYWTKYNQIQPNTSKIQH